MITRWHLKKKGLLNLGKKERNQKLHIQDGYLMNKFNSARTWILK